ncbi:acetyl/propionyl/methylcrotonyl-CoA carboxylase subunit alpha [Streptomyces violaceusniger]|uniref:acetyl/propionyl/methylcrotonyl-CoA carboxylase subunit alpha n=1 Tax=Streptomyces violaceusniger TaxID=68280 RepID=UPI0031D2D319
MLKKVLIANRGEIAVRVIRTCRELGVSTVAVHSGPDRDSLPVRHADACYPLGGRTAAETYLDRDALLAVVERSGADGVHPGYGFLSEDAEFAQAVLDRGVAFIGPPPDVIATMGDKISARRTARAAGVPVLPGGGEPLCDVGELVQFGEEHGWPTAVKAAFGGGGRGMRVIASADGAADAMAAAEREALASCGRPELYAERFLDRPRHIETQVLADTHGNVVWLGERDCTAQRRHRKLIEECPAPGLPDEVRRAMGEASVRLARACHYTGVGTVEFLYQDGAFFFLEMNTRLQVEHPVTELVTGLDLVEWQLRVTSGERLAFGQDDIAVTGHAIEVRINAEDPTGGRFTPSTGTLTRFDTPSGPGVRVDSGYATGETVGPYYDSLVAKAAVWAPDRDRARARTLRALDETRIEGVATSLPAQRAILGHPDFAAVRHSTNWVDRDLDLSAVRASSAPAQAPEPPEPPQPRRWRSRRGVPSLTTWPPNGTAEAPKPRRDDTRPGGTSVPSPGSVVAPAQGTVVGLPVSPGDAVRAGDAVCVIEAMKMETTVRAPVTGRVTELRVAAGEQVASGAIVAVIGAE